MNTEDAAPGLPAPLPEKTPAAPGGRVRWLLPLFVALPGLAACTAAFLLWQRLEHVQGQLAAQVLHLEQTARAAHQQADAASTQARQLGQDSARQIPELQARMAEMQQQGVRMATRMEDLLRRSEGAPRDGQLASDLESTLQLAAQYARASGSVQFLAVALQNARARIERADIPHLLPALAALDADLGQIARLHVPDTAGLLAQLQRMEDQAERLRLPSAFAARPPTPDPAAGAQAPQPLPGADAPPAQDAPDSASPWQWPWWRARAEHAWQQWGARGWAQVSGQMGDLVRVRRLDASDPRLLAPEQGYLLRENLRRHLQAARMSILARQWAMARIDVQRAADMLAGGYFGDDLSARRLDEQLQKLLEALHPPGQPDIQRSLSALAAAQR